MWTSNHKKYLLFLSIVFLVGLVGGGLFVFFLKEDSKEMVLENINAWVGSDLRISLFLPHIFALSVLFVLSFFIIGLPIYIFFMFYNGFSVGFTVASIGSIFQIKGIIYGIIYVLISRGIFLVLLLIFIFFLVRIGEKVFLIMTHKSNKNEGQLILGLVKKSLIVLLLILINDTFLYFWGAKLVNIFKFLII